MLTVSGTFSFSCDAPWTVDSDLAFSPDGRRMVYVRANDPEPGKYRLLAANADGGDEAILRITHSTRGTDPTHVTWSPDGKQVLYSFFSAGEALAYVESFDLASKQVSTWAAFKSDQVFQLKWLPGGRWLLAVFAEKGPNIERTQIGLLSSKGELQPITRDTNRYATLTLSGDGRSVSSVQLKTTRTLTLLNGGGSPTKPTEPKLLSQVADPRQIDWTPDGKLLVADGASITRLDPDGQNAAVLVSDRSASLISLSSCGERYLLLSWAGHVSGNNTVIWRTNVDGSAPKALSSGIYDTSPLCSADGKWVYFVDRPGISHLMRVPLDGGKAESVPGADIPSEVIADFHWSPDGKTIAVIREHDVADVVLLRERNQ